MKHVWAKSESTSTERGGWEYCRYCMAIRRADDKNPPCKGAVKIRQPEKFI